MDAAQRPRPIPSGPQLAGESVEELVDSGALDRLDAYAVDAGRSPVSTDLADALRTTSLRATLSNRA